MKRMAGLILVLTFAVMSCNSDDGENRMNDIQAPASTPAGTNDANSTTQPTQTGTTDVPVTPAQPVSTTTPGTTGAGLNPEHGKPGHRCDIPVGAPLDSKPSATPATNITSNDSRTAPATITTNPVTVPTATSTTAPGMNPAHGQPGHRCDIPVGSPLNSKPVTSTPAQTTTDQMKPIMVLPPPDSARKQ